MKGKRLFAVTLILASQLAFADGDEPFAVGAQPPSKTSSGVIARPIVVDSGKLNHNLDIITKKRVGEDALTTLELTLIDQKKQYIDDKARLAKIQVEMKNDAFWRNTNGTASAAFAVLTALSVRYGVKSKWDPAGPIIGTIVGGVGTLLTGGFALGSESDRRSAMAEAAGISAAIQGRLDLVHQTEARIKTIRGQALSR